MRQIKNVTVVTRQGVKSYEIGDEVNGLQIAQIKDKGNEWEDHVDYCYHCLDSNGGLVVAIENCPATVEYGEG